jgi:ribosome-binding protein aMBF1 (putative translation factor)
MKTENATAISFGELADMPPPTPPRKIGRPKGARDHQGSARRFDPRWMPAYRARIGQLLRAARLEADISVYELEAACGINGSHIYKIESGQRGCAVETLIKLAVACGVSPREVMP